MNGTSAGWQRVVDVSLGQSFKFGLIYVLPAGFLGLFAARVVVDVFAADAPPWAQIVLVVGVAASILSVAALVVARVRRALYVNFSERLIRIRRTVVRFEEINVAAIEGAGAGNAGNAYVLRFGVDKGVSARVPLQRGPKGMSDESRQRLLTVLRASNIGMPSDSYDPHGKFARYNFPENVTKEQVLDIVENHPEPYGPHTVY